MRISADGLYYRIKAETLAGIRFIILVYVKPEDDYVEILSYESLNPLTTQTTQTNLQILEQGSTFNPDQDE